MLEKKPTLGKVLVIGGAGMLGHHTVQLLLSSWTASVSVLDLRAPRNPLPGATYHEADITDAAAVEAVFAKAKPAVVIHTASPAAQGDDAVARELFRKVNVDGTKVIVEACQKSGVTALVYTSSASIMNDNQSDLVNANEGFPVIRGEYQTEYYSETKAEAEELVLKANRQDGFPLLTAAIRPASIFGEYDAMLTKHMVNLHLQGRTNVQVGDNNNLFDFTYAANAAHAHLLAAQRLLATASTTTVPLNTERVDGQAFIVTNDTPVYFWDFCRAFWKAAGRDKGNAGTWHLPTDLGIALGWFSEVFFGIIGKPPTFNRQRIIYSSMTRYYNITKAKTRLEYKPLVSLEEGIQRSVDWYLGTLKEAQAPVKA